MRPEHRRALWCIVVLLLVVGCWYQVDRLKPAEALSKQPEERNTETITGNKQVPVTGGPPQLQHSINRTTVRRPPSVSSNALKCIPDFAILGRFLIRSSVALSFPIF